MVRTSKAQWNGSLKDGKGTVALGSGDVPVLATPRLLAWMEAVTVTAATEHLADGETSVGVHVELRHRRASPVGSAVEVTARSAEAEGGRLTFEVEAVDHEGRVLANGTVTRAVVDRERFSS